MATAEHGTSQQMCQKTKQDVSNIFSLPKFTVLF